MKCISVSFTSLLECYRFWYGRHRYNIRGGTCFLLRVRRINGGTCPLKDTARRIQPVVIWTLRPLFGLFNDVSTSRTGNIWPSITEVCSSHSDTNVSPPEHQSVLQRINSSSRPIDPAEEKLRNSCKISCKNGFSAYADRIFMEIKNVRSASPWLYNPWLWLGIKWGTISMHQSAKILRFEFLHTCGCGGMKTISAADQ